MLKSAYFIETRIIKQLISRATFQKLYEENRDDLMCTIYDKGPVYLTILYDNTDLSYSYL